MNILHIVEVPIIKQVKNQTEQQSFRLTFLSIAVVLKTVLSTEDSVGNQRQIDHCNGHNYRYVGGGLLSKRGTDCCWLSEWFLGFIPMLLKNQRTDGSVSLRRSPQNWNGGSLILK